MNDYEYTFKQDVREKKTIGNGAFHKKNGSKSHYVSLPSDHLSRKEKEALNGEVKTWNLMKPMKWAEFEEMPLDLQERYLAMIVDGYNVAANQIADMFGVPSKRITRYIQENGFKTVNIKRKRVLRGDRQDDWDRFLSGEPFETVEDSEPSETEYKPLNWEEFRSLQDDEANNYIQYLKDTFGVSASMIARELLGTTTAGFANYRKNHAINVVFPNCKTPKLSDEQAAAWSDFVGLSSDISEPATDDLCEEEVSETADDIYEEEYVVPVTDVPDTFTMTFNNTTVNNLADILKTLIGVDLIGELTVTFRKEK